MIRRRFNLLLTLVLLVALLGLVFVWRHEITIVYRSWQTPKLPVEQSGALNLNVSTNSEQSGTNTLVVNSTATSATNVSSEPLPPVYHRPTLVASWPKDYNLKVPFVRQAPFDDWSDPFNEACEEASVLTLHYWHQGSMSPSQQTMKDDILSSVAWQKNYFGSHKDLTVAETKDLIEKYYGYTDVEVRYNITLDDIKQAVATGYPVIVPAAGRELGNVNFRTPGPIYHMTVVKGYTASTIITNDPGTRNGKDYVYDAKKFYRAIHDWDPGNIDDGPKAMIVIWN